MRRGEIWWAALEPPFGAEPGYRRPVLILQINEFNESPIRTVVAVTLTSNLGRAQAPGNVRCSKQQTGLSKPSVINVSQIATFDKQRLVQRVGVLNRKILSEVEGGVRLLLGL